MNTLDYPMSIHNRFDIEVIDAETGEIKQKAEALNVICDTLWNRLLHVNSNNQWDPQEYNHVVGFGTGTGTPSSSDTALFTLLGTKSGTFEIDGSNFYQGIIIGKRTIVLNPEEYVNQDITEVGIMYSDSGYKTATHAMIKDLNGNIISIHKTSTDIINIYASIYLHFALSWSNGSICWDYQQIEPIYINQYTPSQVSVFDVFLGKSTSTYSNQITGYDIYRIGSRVKTGSTQFSNNDSSIDVSYPYSSTSVNQATKQIINNFTRIGASDTNSIVHRVYYVKARRSNSGYYAPPALLFYAKGWYNPSMISGEAIGTGDGINSGFCTAFPIKTISQVYIDGVPALNYSYHVGPPKAKLMATYMSIYAKRNGAIYPISSNSVIGDLGIDPTTGRTPRYTAPQSMDFAFGNDFYSTFGIKEIRGGQPAQSGRGGGTIKILASDDLETWIESENFHIPYASDSVALTLPTNMKNKKYYKWELVSIDISGRIFDPWLQFVGDFSDEENNVLFATPPAAGSVITIDYTPDCIAKDENHVFDLSMTISLNESQVI